MKKPATDDEVNSSQDETLMQGVSATMRSGTQYIISRLDLVVAETKLAIASIVWIVALAVFALFLAIAIWVLLCVSLSYFLIDAFGFSTAQSLASLALFNFCILLAVARSLGALFQTLSFSESRTLSADEGSVDDAPVPDSPEHPMGHSTDNLDEHAAGDRKNDETHHSPEKKS